MKKCILTLLFLCLGLPQMFAEPSPSVPRLAGLINLPDQKSALLDFPPRSAILREGQREGKIEVIRINPESGAVELRMGGTNVQLTVPSPGEGRPAAITGGSLVLENAKLDPVLQLYAGFKGRTLLRSPRLPEVALSLASVVTNADGAARVLETALAAKGIVTIPDGEKFLMVVPKSEAATVKPRSSEIKPLVAARTVPEPFETGSIHFQNMSVLQAAGFYAGLSGRKLERTASPSVMQGSFNLRNQSTLTRDELGYALETLLSWQGLKVVPAEDGWAKVIVIPQGTQR